MSAKDSSLYGIPKPAKKASGKDISSSTTLSFTSQLSSLISSSTNNASSRSNSGRARPKKEDIFATHNRDAAKRARRDLEDLPVLAQKHTVDGEGLDRNAWEKSKHKMEEKARLYAAMKRGDIEDADERYAVDFDRKWAENGEGAGDISSSDDDETSNAEEEKVEYTDEFGRTRTGTRSEATLVELKRNAPQEVSDRFTARPAAPANIIYGDTIQTFAFNPDEAIAVQMEELARKRDKSLTPPPEEHFDASREVRMKGTGFFQFSGDKEERERQMQDLEKVREETERRRSEREAIVAERKRQIEARRAEIKSRRGKRKADDFLEELGVEIGGKLEDCDRAGRDRDGAGGMVERIEAAVQKEEVEH